MTVITALTSHRGHIAYRQGAAEQHDIVLRAPDGSARTLVAGVRCAAERQQLVWGDDALFYAAARANWFHEVHAVNLMTGETQALTDYYRVHTEPIALHRGESVSRANETHDVTTP